MSHRPPSADDKTPARGDGGGHGHRRGSGAGEGRGHNLPVEHVGQSATSQTTSGTGARTAAFYDVDGTLIKSNIVHAFAWYASHQPTLLGSLGQTLGTALSLPLFGVADKVSRKLFNELFYRYYKGQSEDRLVTLAEELFEDVIRPSIFPGARALIDQSRRAGSRQVIVSGGLDFTVRPLARYLGVDDFIANRLEFFDHVATGKIRHPFVAGASKADIIRAYAAEHDLDLQRSWAYSDSYSDYAMLVVVGHPAVINPDLRLRSVARSYDWPILDLS